MPAAMAPFLHALRAVCDQDRADEEGFQHGSGRIWHGKLDLQDVTHGKTQDKSVQLVQLGAISLRG